MTVKVKNDVQIKKAPIPEDVVALLPDQHFVELRGEVIMWGLLVAMAVSGGCLADTPQQQIQPAVSSESNHSCSQYPSVVINRLVINHI